ncbi:drug/metabolite transporter (DMT)-like permease [Neobacillus niacini]|nr:drug/metabolite transporter (DMT)-like permease [Neobacillus niacini]
MKNSILGAVYLSLAASIWGGMYVVSKYVLQFIPPITLVWLRYAIGFVVLYAILNIVQRKTKVHAKMDKKDWLIIGWIGFIGYFALISFQFIGMKLSDAHTGSLITSATPAFIVIFARFVLKEPLTLKKIVKVSLISPIDDKIGVN